MLRVDDVVVRLVVSRFEFKLHEIGRKLMIRVMIAVWLILLL